MFQKKNKKGFRTLINYHNFVADGVIVNKDGSLTGGFYYFGVDLDSLTPEERHAISCQVNAVFATLDGGWTINVDSLRMPVTRYPLTHQSSQPSIHLIEAERRKHFEKKEIHYQSVYALTLTFKPGLLQDKKFRKVFVSGESIALNDRNMSHILNEFEKVMDKVYAGLLATQLTIERMDSDNLFSFLHYCITGEFQDGSKLIGRFQDNPEMIESLDYVLGGYDYIAGLKPIIDGKFISVVSVLGVPLESYSGMLDVLNALQFSYRSSMRFIILDPIEAQSLITKIRTKWNNKQFSLINAVMQLVSPGSESRFENEEAIQKSLDANLALSESQGNVIRYGFYTHSIVVIGESEEINTKQAKQLAQSLKNNGFPARIESINCIEGYLGSHPGNTQVNICKPVIHTLNFSHFIPLNSHWMGNEFNPHPKFPKESPALFAASTISQTPFFANIHVEDVGHHALIGATGYGKTSGQRFIISSFLRYPDAQVFAFDNRKGFYSLANSCGGDFYEILDDNNALSFCPLQGIDSDSEKLWAAGWIEDLITLQGVQVTPKQRQAISEALDALRSDKVKSLSNLYANLQDRSLKSALDPFVTIQNGVMSRLLDSSSNNLSDSNFQVFEVGGLLSLDPKFAIPVVSYLFHKIETRLDGRPTLIVLSETWKLFNTDYFASKINEWLRQCRAKNASVSFETHSLSDISGPLKNVILVNCPTKIYLPNPMAQKVNDRQMYNSFGLNDGQIELIANAIPKRHYYWTSPEGSCLIDLQLQPAFLTLMGKNTKADIEFIKSLIEKHGELWPARYLEANGYLTESKKWEQLHQQLSKEGQCHE